MLDQSIWWFSFFMARCERIARSIHAWRKSRRQEGCRCDLKRDAVWCHRQSPQPTGQEQRAVGEGWQNLNGGESPMSFSSPASSPVVSVCWATTLSLKMAIIGWGEFTNKTYGNVDSCFESAWQVPVFWSLVLRTGSLLPLTEAGPAAWLPCSQGTDSLFAA